MKTHLGTLALIVSSLLVAFIVGEVFLRWYGVDPSTDRLTAYQFDETLGWATKKNFKYYRSSLEYGQFNYYNPDGFPATFAEWKTPASTTMPTVAILGDSFAESYYVPFEKSFPYLLGKSLPGKQTIDLGVSGYAPDQYLLRARQELGRFSVQTIIVTFFPYNDLPDLDSDTYQGYAKPYFGDSFDKPVNTPLVLAGGHGEQGNWLVRNVRNTAIYTLIRPLLRKHIAINLKSGSAAKPYDPAHMKKAIAILAQIHKENPNASFLVYEIPHLREMDDPSLYKSNLEIFENECKQQNISCTSMDSIIKASDDYNTLFIQGDGHLTAKGSALVAEELLHTLNASTSTADRPH